MLTKLTHCPPELGLGDTRWFAVVFGFFSALYNMNEILGCSHLKTLLWVDQMPNIDLSLTWTTERVTVRPRIV